MDMKVMKDHVFPPCKPVSCGITDLQLAGSGMLLSEAGHLFVEAE
jgi:hypothetical protein